MDPYKTLENILSDLDAENYESAFEATEDLLCWINKGGFIPDASPKQIRDLIYELNWILGTKVIRTTKERPDV